MLAFCMRASIVGERKPEKEGGIKESGGLELLFVQVSENVPCTTIFSMLLFSS